MLSLRCTENLVHYLAELLVILNVDGLVACHAVHKCEVAVFNRNCDWGTAR